MTTSDIAEMSGAEFESLIQKLLTAMGFELEQCSTGPDGGIDILAVSHSDIVSGRYVIQCKRYSQKVGVGPVRDLFGTVMAEGANKGVLITNAKFTQGAVDFAEGKPLELVDGTRLEALLRNCDLGGTEVATAPRMSRQHKLLIEAAREWYRLIVDRQEDIDKRLIPIPSGPRFTGLADLPQRLSSTMKEWDDARTLIINQINSFFAEVGKDTDPERLKRGIVYVRRTLNNLLGTCAPETDPVEGAVSTNVLGCIPSRLRYSTGDT